MFEHRTEPLLPVGAFLTRMARSGAGALLIVTIGWAVGTLGYRLLEDLPWIDALLNAAMILSGMGPVSPLHTTAGKLFASFYALASGFLFLSAAAVLLAPLVHRMMHRFHLSSE